MRRAAPRDRRRLGLRGRGSNDLTPCPLTGRVKVRSQALAREWAPAQTQKEDDMRTSTSIADQVAEQVWGGAPILVAIKEAGGKIVRIDASDYVTVTYYRFDDGSEIWIDASGDWDVVEKEETPAIPPIEPKLLG